MTTVSGFLYKFEMENVKLLQAKGYEVHYAANEAMPCYLVDEAVKQTSGVVFHPVGIEKPSIKFRQHMHVLHEIVDIIRQEQITVVHCHTPMGGVLGRLAGKQCKKYGIELCVIYTVHGFHFYHGASPIKSWIYKFAEAYLAHYTDVLITINREDYQIAKKFHLRQKGKVYQIPGVGLDMEYFIPATGGQRKKAREELGILENQLFLLSVGEVNQNKNHRVIIDVLHELKKQGGIIEALRYGICGDGALREELYELMKKYGLEHTVTFFGYQKDIKSYLWAADLFVFPSRREGLGMAALEALACGIPLIAADNRGSREYVVHGRNGFLCQCDNKNDYIRYIRMMLSMPLHGWKQMRTFCRKSVERFDKKYTREVMEQAYAEL